MNRQITILWAGGYDELIVDPSTIRDLTTEEIKSDAARLARGFSSDPFVANAWLRGNFFDELNDETKAVKILRRLAHGE